MVLFSYTLFPSLRRVQFHVGVEFSRLVSELEDVQQRGRESAINTVLVVLYA